MEDKKIIVRCDECGGKIVKDYVRNESYCDVCGLVIDNLHMMGRGIDGLIQYVNHRSLNDHTEVIRVVYFMEGLAKARLMVSKLWLLNTHIKDPLLLK